jgi:hypothetical protein
MSACEIFQYWFALHVSAINSGKTSNQLLKPAAL